MSAVTKSLKCSSKHTSHLGRILGPKCLEMKEFSQEEIRLLGNWHPNVQESAYSTQVPMKALRSMAGFDACGGVYYNPRSNVKVPEELCNAVFPWLADSMKRLNAHEEEHPNDLKPTAHHFLTQME